MDQVKGFTEQYEEGVYETYDEAQTVADRLLNHLTARERKYNTVQIVNEQGEIVWRWRATCLYGQ